MKVSIVIPTYNNLELTKKCLLAIRKNSRDVGHEIIAVDNASTDDTQDFLKTQKDVVSILNKKNRNFAGACNQGARAAKNEIVLFLNNDTEVHPGWLEPIIEDFKKQPGLGAVGVKLLFPNGRIQHAGVVFFDSKVPEHLYRLEKPNQPKVNMKRSMQAVTAACLAIPREIFLKVGGFDEAYKNGLEDIDLCLRLGEAGYKIIYEPRSVVTHHESVSPGRHLNNLHNLNLYMERWSDKVRPDSHEIMKADGYSRMQILYMDTKYMSYVPENYGTVPRHILALRKIYLSPVRSYAFLKRLPQRIIGKVRRCLG